MSYLTKSQPSRPRTTMELSSGYHRHTHTLSFEAHMALHYAALLASRACHLKVHHAAIVRRAVCRYAIHLGELNPEQLRQEVVAIRDASRASNGYQSHQEAALARLEAMEQTNSTAPLKDVLEGKDYSPPLDFAAMEATVEAVLATRRRFITPKKGNTSNGTE